MRLPFAATLLAALAGAAGATAADVSPHLAPLAPLLGKTWRTFYVEDPQAVVRFKE